jgi:signal transduction histidine kinase
MKQGILYLFILAFSIVANSQNVDSLMEIGIKEFEQGEYQDARKSFDLVGKIATSQNDSLTLYVAFNNLGNVYSRMNDQLNGLKYYRMALSLAEKLNDQRRLAKTKLNIGTFYSDLKEFDKAIPWYKQAFDDAKSTNDSALSAYCLNNLAVIYEQLNENKLALKVHKQALIIHKSMRDTANVAQTLSNLAIVYKKQGLFNESIKNYKEALNYSQLVNDQFIEAVTLNNLANVYLEIGQFDKALSHIKLAYDKSVKIGASEITVETYDGYAQIYERLGNYPEALRYRKLYEQEKDKMNNEQRLSQITELEERFQSERKQTQILVLEQNQHISDLLIREQSSQIQRRNYILIGLILLISFISILIYSRGRQKKLVVEISRQKLIKESSEKERQRISRDIHDDFGSGLSKINMLSELIISQSSNNELTTEPAKKIGEATRHLVDNMKGLIWMLNSENTNLQDLLLRIREYSSDYMDDFAMTLQSNYPKNIPQIIVRKEVCHALFMTIKEFLNNAIKHSNGSQINISATFNENKLSVLICDDGIGFDSSNSRSGHGLKIMKERISSIGGHFELNSSVGNGTKLNLEIPV